MIELLSFGDKLDIGKYQVHSRFEKVINLVSGESLVSIVKEEIGRGPLNIILGNLDLTEVKALTISHDFLEINRSKIELNPARRYCSRLNLSEKPGAWNRYANLTYFKECLVEYSPAKSLAVILDPKREREFTSSVEKEMLDLFKNSLGCSFGHYSLNNVAQLKGCGFGLTPSGDDLIAGAITGFHVIQRLENKDLWEKINYLYNAAKGTNMIVNAMLRCAHDGYLIETYHRLLDAVFYRDRAAIREQTKRLIQIGETSGADWGVGLYMALKSAA